MGAALQTVPRDQGPNPDGVIMTLVIEDADGWQNRRARVWAIRKSITGVLETTGRDVPPDWVLDAAAAVVVDRPADWFEGGHDPEIAICLGAYHAGLHERADPGKWADRLEREARSTLGAIGLHLGAAHGGLTLMMACEGGADAFCAITVEEVATAQRLLFRAVDLQAAAAVKRAEALR